MLKKIKKQGNILPCYDTYNKCCALLKKMAFPKKKSRRIIVNNHQYRWMVKGDFYGVMLLIISEEYNRQKLFANFRHSINGEKSCMYDNPFIIEPELVKRTILFGLSKGYSPNQKGNDLNLGDLSQQLVLNLKN
ncbi:hypothetical protein GCM10009430_23680 [Aquimarina litoralis]|uniref:Uncharacterized protein n=1 Tax=Aquimarina litoralis TaxID=584605 RepID=A0ABP3U0C5_9FLAO